MISAYKSVFHELNVCMTNFAHALGGGGGTSANPGSATDNINSTLLRCLVPTSDKTMSTDALPNASLLPMCMLPQAIVKVTCGHKPQSADKQSVGLNTSQDMLSGTE